MLSTTQIDELADKLIDQIDFPACLRVFEWAGQSLQPAWESRQALSSAGFDNDVVAYAERVHRWGFRGQAVRASIRQHAAYSASLSTLCRGWSDAPPAGPNPEAIASLITLLEIKYLGIARVSKFICFLDQDRYAIYDSRVSYALKNLTLDGVKRVFPFVGGRPVKHAQYVLADPAATEARRMVPIYIGFLGLLQQVAVKLNARGGVTDPYLAPVVGNRWTPALLEMALFMAGQYRYKTPDLRPFDARLWDRSSTSAAATSVSKKPTPTRRGTVQYLPSLTQLQRASQ